MKKVFYGKSDEEIVKKFIENMEIKTRNPDFWSKSKKTKNIRDMPRKYPLTETEKHTIAEKYNKYISIQFNAIAIVSKYIKKFDGDVEYKTTIEDLKRGLHILEVGISKDIEKGIEGFVADLEKFPKGSRPGFGLSRGFGEFLRALPKEDEYWASEIMDAVHAIEDYYRSM